MNATIVAVFFALISIDSELERVNLERFRLMTERDVAALEKLLADDVVYVHSDGTEEGKARFLERLRSGAMRYRSITPAESVVRAFQDFAVVTGRALMAVTMEGTDRDVELRYTAVYRKDGGRWVLISWQSTALRR